MKSDEYEEIVREIVKAVFQQCEGIEPTQVESGRKNTLEGASGHKHQIDVSLTGPKDLILVECKCWGRNIPVEMVLAFFGRVYDIKAGLGKKAPTLHPVIVTRKGFQPGAKKVAEFLRIELEYVKSAGEFAFKYKTLLSVGVTDCMQFGDSFAAELKKASDGSTVEERSSESPANHDGKA